MDNTNAIRLEYSNLPDKPDLLGTEELEDFIDLLYSGMEAYEKAREDGMISISDIVLLGSFSVNLFAAVNGASAALSEAMDLTDEEILDLVDKSDSFELGNNCPKYRQLVKELLFKFQTFSLFS